MTTPLDKPIKRELQLGEQAYTVTITALGVRIVPKGKRLGQEITWRDLLDGGLQLNAQLRQSLRAATDAEAAERPSGTKRRR